MPVNFSNTHTCPSIAENSMGIRETMRRIRTGLFRRRTTPTTAESSPMMSTRGEDRQTSNNPEPAPQSARNISTSDPDAHLFGLRFLANALTTLEHGILRLEYTGLFLEARGIRNLWRRSVEGFVRNSAIQYESAERVFDVSYGREHHLGLALNEIGMALVAAESTMARWEWVPVIAELRVEIAELFERHGWTLREADV